MNNKTGSHHGSENITGYFILCVALFTPPGILADERIRLYEEEDGVPKYSGYMERQYNGSIRIYDKRGRFKGRIEKGRMYSKDGSFVSKSDVFRMDNGK